MADILWYDRAAGKDWNAALPLGSGRLGAMVFGNPGGERVQLNEDTVWSGGARDRINPDAIGALPEIRRLILAGELAPAHALADRALAGVPDSMLNYQPLADLWLDFSYPTGNGMQTRKEGDGLLASRITTDDSALALEDYRRELDLAAAEVRVAYGLCGVRYRREYLASFPDGVVAIRLTADKPGALTFAARLTRGNWQNYVSRYFDRVEKADGEALVGSGRSGGEGGHSFAVALRCRAQGGKVTLLGENILVEGADEVILTIAGATGFRFADPVSETLRATRAASDSSWGDLVARHRADHAALYDRVKLELPVAGPDLPVDQRVERLRAGGDDPDLLRLFFDYGRYLLIASSRPGSLPANLQGRWCQDMEPAWGGKYTININTEMNYWPAEQCALAECHEPLFEMIERLAVSGREVARRMYGCRGFVAHHNTDLSADACPTDRNLSASYWVVGGAWLSLHLWERCLFSGARADFERAWPILRDASLFFLDFLIEDHARRLVVCPGCSPENAYRLPSGSAGTLCAGASMDTQIVECLFAATIELAGLLGVDAELAREIETARARLPQPKIGKHGQIQEWAEDYDEIEPGHRHISHLFALHPGGRFDPVQSPELAEAARVTLRRRLAGGGGGTGWSRAWIINFYARLHDGAEAHRHLNHLVAHCTLPNLFDDHPPFQIDGNFGACSGIAEMLVQSHRPAAGGKREVHLLPALPDAWPQGSVCGLRVRGAGSVDLEWSGGVLTRAVLHAAPESSWQIRYTDVVRTLAIPASGSLEIRP